MLYRSFLIGCLSLLSLASMGQIKIAKLKYSGGGDWYANKTALPNLIDFCNKQLLTRLHKEEDVVEVGSPDLFLYPYVYMTGHGKCLFFRRGCSKPPHLSFIGRLFTH